MFFHLQPEEALLCDVNHDLVLTYAAVRDHVRPLVEGLRSLSTMHCQEQYYWIRDQFNSGNQTDWLQRAAWFIYLNKCCFNGVWRVNKSGGYNVPIGKFASGPNIVNEEVLHLASAALQGTDLLHASFDTLLEEAWEGDFIYLDPPYEPVSATSDFTTYVAGGFSQDAQRQLAEVCVKLHERGCMLMLSNSDAPLIHTLYSQLPFNITPVQAPRSVNSKTDSRGLVAEVVVRNY